MLKPQEKEDIFAQLLHHISVAGDPQATMRGIVHDSVRARLPLSADSVSVFVQASFDICIAGGRTPVIAILTFLIDQMGNPQFAPIRARLELPQPIVAHPMETEIIDGSFPFANRQQLRDILRRMVNVNVPRPILHITGAPQSGKSWTYYLLQHWARRTDEGAHLICQIEVSEDSGQDAGPVEIAKDLVSQMGGASGTLPQMANAEAYHNDLARWVFEVANNAFENAEQRAWIVFDGFNQAALRPDTLDFLTALAQRCTKGVNAKRHRIVFCELAHDISAKIRMGVSPYETAPISRDDVRDVVRATVAMRPGLPPDDIRPIAEAITDGILADMNEPYDNLAEIGRQLELHIAETAV